MDGIKSTSVLVLLLAAYPIAAPAQDSALYPIMRQAKIGFIDRQGNVVIEPKFDPTGAFDSGKAVFSEGLEPVAKDFTTWGYINRNGEVKIPFRFSLAEPFSEGLAAVRVGSKYGYIDHSGTLKIPAMFDYAGAFSAGMTWVVVDGKTGYIDKSGSFLVRPQFGSGSAEFSTFSEGLAGASQGGLWGFIDKKGDWVIPAQYKSISAFHDGLAAVYPKGELNCKYIDHSGTTVLGPFNMAWRFSEGLARVNLHGRMAFIDPQGKIQFTLPDDVQWAEPFAEGLAKVQFRAEPSGVEKIGYIDHSGKFVIPAIYQVGSASFQNGLAFVSTCGQSGYIGKNGEPVWGIKPRTSPAHSQPAPSSKILTPELLAKITHHPGPLILKELPVSDVCDPFGKKIWSVAVNTAERIFHPLTINLLEGGTFLTDERIGNLKANLERFSNLGLVSQFAPRAIDPAKKLTGYASIAGAGPGGSMIVGSIFSPNQQYEVQVLVAIASEGDVVKTTDQTKDYAAQVKDPLGFVNSVGLEILSKLFPAGKGTQEQP